MCLGALGWQPSEFWRAHPVDMWAALDMRARMARAERDAMEAARREAGAPRGRR